MIDGLQEDSVVAFQGTEDETCLLSGFSISNGKSYSGAGIRGGNLSPWPPSLALAEISNCKISGCLASDSGGGLGYCSGTIINCTISGNTAGGSGGGLSHCTGTISNCTITANSAQYNGGGLGYCSGMISNCTISANSAEWDGGGLHSFDGVTGNCIVWGNSAPKGPELLDCRYAVITCCCIRGWTEGGEGNFDADPLFATGPQGIIV
ncbi:right-handed parallel beta-helix repeat-containing protein [bacterium]|nr:right-handed parallel beta-helix repeat-containing protein [bacterium]